MRTKGLTYKQAVVTWLEHGVACENKLKNVFSEGDTLYSYGYHFPMARRKLVGDNNKQVFWVAERTSTATTNKHISYVMYRVSEYSHMPAFVQPNMRNGDWSSIAHWYNKEIASLKKSIENARLEHKKEAYARVQRHYEFMRDSALQYHLEETKQKKEA